MRCLVLACLLVVMASCMDGGECLNYCDTYLDVEIDGLSAAAAGQVELRICDGSYCDTFYLNPGECDFQEPTADPGFNACRIDGKLSIQRIFTMRDSFLPLPNDQVSVVVTDSTGAEVLNTSDTPTLVDAMSCVEGCMARELRL